MSKTRPDEKTRNRLKGDLIACLSDVDRAHSPATFAVCPQPLNPGIEIEGLGRVGLPLSKRDAETIAKLSHQAPFGMGSETIVDLDVRKTWELNPNQFKTANPSWVQALEEIVENVKTELGVNSEVEAQPHKMLLYGEGAMFKPHKDSEKAPGMFGTLVICLPSEHEGGQVHLTHGSKEIIFDTAKSSRFDASYLAWYADITHEIKPVTSGYRFVLTYNLIQNGTGDPPLAEDAENKKAALQKIISTWKDINDRKPSECPGGLVYMLDHSYTKANIGFNQLKGQDMIRVRYLQEVCGQNSFSVFLVNIERVVVSHCEGEYTEDDWPELYERGVRDVEGYIHRTDMPEREKISMALVLRPDDTIKLQDVPLNRKDIVQRRAFPGNPDKEDWEGPTGNEGVETTHYYRKSAALLIPNNRIVEFFLRGYNESVRDTGLESWIKQLSCNLKDSQEEKSRSELRTLCRSIAETACEQYAELRTQDRKFGHPRNAACSECVLSEVIKASVLLDDFELLRNILAIVIVGAPPSVYPAIGHAVGHFGFDRVQPLIDNPGTKDFGFRDLQRALEGIVSGYKADNEDETQLKDLSTIKAWAKESLEKSLGVLEISRQEDDRVLFSIMTSTDDIEVSRRVLSIVEQNPDCMEFVSGFLSCLFQAHKEGKVEGDLVTEGFCKIVSRVIPVFTLCDVNRLKSLKGASSGWCSTMIAPRDLANIIHLCTKLNMEDEVDRIFARLAAEVSNCEEYSPLECFDLLKELCGIAGVRSREGYDDKLLEKFRPSAHICVDAFFAHHGEKPSPPKSNWVRTAYGCGCNDCNVLDELLLDPERKAGSVPLDSERRYNHLRTQLNTTASRRERIEFKVENPRSDEPPNSLRIRKLVVNRAGLLLWKERMQKLKSMLRSLGDAKLLRFLLQDRYEKVFERTQKNE
ncbi:hypothetical protein FQN54_009198 [Arachnomyces sp. PD_36]|nr:hypothetical protein FQN54_009198 [Arachnomyces sp. PD_36]